MSINTSTVEFLKGDISSKFAAILREYEMDAERINIEITERYMLEHDPVSESELKELRRMGHTICVDDFGSASNNQLIVSTFYKLAGDVISLFSIELLERKLREGLSKKGWGNENENQNENENLSIPILMKKN